jgi:hypothetical protein
VPPRVGGAAWWCGAGRRAAGRGGGQFFRRDGRRAERAGPHALGRWSGGAGGGRGFGRVHGIRTTPRPSHTPPVVAPCLAGCAGAGGMPRKHAAEAEPSGSGSGSHLPAHHASLHHVVDLLRHDDREALQLRRRNDLAPQPRRLLCGHERGDVGRAGGGGGGNVPGAPPRHPSARGHRQGLGRPHAGRTPDGTGTTQTGTTHWSPEMGVAGGPRHSASQPARGAPPPGSGCRQRPPNPHPPPKLTVEAGRQVEHVLLLLRHLRQLLEERLVDVHVARGARRLAAARACGG